MNVPFADVTVEQFDTLYNVNIRAMFFVTQTCLPALVASQGAIVNMTSVHALEAMNEHSVYAGTKGAIISFTIALARELAPRNIGVNCVAAGLMRTGMLAAALDADLQKYNRRVPLGRVARTEEIAHVVAFLCSDRASYMTGATVDVSGGLAMH